MNTSSKRKENEITFSKMLPLFFFILTLLIFNQTSYATDCLGPINAKINVIYLHGIDTTKPNSLELQNRERLQKIANALSARISLPRSPQLCKDQTKLCWNPNIDQAENAKALLQEATELSKECFHSNDSQPHLIGFSSGGFLVNKIIRYCLKRNFQSIMSIGASSATDESDPRDLTNCSPLRMLVSRTEATREAAEKFYSIIKQRNGNIRLDYFDGDHELPQKETLKILDEQIKDTEK